MRYLKLFEQIYPGYTTTSTVDYDKEEKINITLEDLQKLFLKYKDTYKSNQDINDLKNTIKGDLDEDTYKKLNIKHFLRALEVEKSINIDQSFTLFDEYIDSLERRYRKIFLGDESNYETDELSKLKKMKKAFKNSLSYRIMEEEKDALYVELTKMIQYIKKNGLKVLVTIDGRDTGGKGSLAKFIVWNYFASPMWNRNIFYRQFGVPTKYESRNWFFRYKKVLPQPGQLVFFDRSWYNRAVNDPVMGYCTEEQYKRFMDNVIPFEEKLKQDDIIHIKFWLSIEKETQEKRFSLRKASPIKSFKFSPNDLLASERWDPFTEFKNEMFRRTSTEEFPWVVVAMDDKPLGWLNSLRYILNKIPYDNKNEKILKVYPEVVYEV